MSNIYIQEPPTSGKVLLKTSVGELEIELWSKEAPKTCRNFVQLCLDGFYNGTHFHRLVKNFIVQGGENSEPADLIEPIKNEFHSRLRFSRRGLVGMATNEGSDNNMQFFITLDQTPELQNTHTIFGKITGDTIYNMIKLNDSQTDHNERVVYPHKISKVKIISNPFPDINPRYEKVSSKSKGESSSSKKKDKPQVVKNFKLISFGDEAEMDEMEVSNGKTHKKIGQSSSTGWKKDSKKERKKSETPPKTPTRKEVTQVDEDDESDEDFETSMENEKMAELERKRKEIRDQIKDLKKEYQSSRKDKNADKPDEQQQVSKNPVNQAIQSYLDEKEKYKNCKVKTKGASREQETLKLLEKFKKKLHSASTSANPSNSDDENWLGHKLDFSESQEAVLAKDASKKADDWYDIYDPRNPLNKRKRGENFKEDGSSMKRK